MEENKNIELEKELQEDLDFRSKAISRSIERRRTMDSLSKIKEACNYLEHWNLVIYVSDVINHLTENDDWRWWVIYNKVRADAQIRTQGPLTEKKHSVAIATLEITEKNLSELMDPVDILDFNQKYSIFDLINDPGILSDEKHRKLLVKYFGKAVWEKEGSKTC